MLNKISLVLLASFAVACSGGKDTGDSGATTGETTTGGTTDGGTTTGGTTDGGASDGGSTTGGGASYDPAGTNPGCTVNSGENANLYCWESADTTAENCSASYLTFSAGGCPTSGIIAVCSDIPQGGDYAGPSVGFYYEGHGEGKQDACETLANGTYSEM